MTVLVIGGGIAGLAAARDLGKAAIPTLLVEASDRLGGKIATERVDDFVIELGPDSMLTTRPAAVALARELGLGDELISVSEPRSVHILRNGRPIPMPEGVGLVLPTRARPFISTRLFSWPEKARMGVDLVMPRVLPMEDVSVGAFLRRRLGSALVSRLAGPLVGGIYGTSIDELSLDAIVPTLREAERTHRSLILAGLADGRRMRGAAAASSSTPLSPRPLGVFASLHGGMGQLVAALERELESMSSVSIVRGVRLTSLASSGSGYRAQSADGRVFDADALVVATPGPAAAQLLAEVAPAAATAITTIPHGSTSVVNLAYSVDQFPKPINGHGWLIPATEGLPLSALTWSSNKWAGRAPTGWVLIRAFLPDQPSDGRSAQDLVKLARVAVERLTGVTGSPELVRVSAHKGTMPRYTVGHIARVERAEAELAAQARIALAGAPYRGVGLPDCISGARNAARKIIEALDATDERGPTGIRTQDTGVGFAPGPNNPTIAAPASGRTAGGRQRGCSPFLDG